VEEDQLNVLHDFDKPYLSGRWALKRSWLLFLYALSRRLAFLRPACRTVYLESYEYAWTLFRLDRLLGIESVFGINDDVSAVYPTLSTELASSGARVTRHWHVSPTEVHWDSLDVPASQWWFDQEYAQGKRKGAKPSEWIVFHADYPHLLETYIKCLYELRFGSSQRKTPASKEAHRAE
jgi:hypothetical protein